MVPALIALLGSLVRHGDHRRKARPEEDPGEWLAAKKRETNRRIAPLISIQERSPMSVARVIEISSTSDKSFEDAIQQGVARAAKTLRQLRSAWIKEQEVQIQGDQIVAYKVNLMVTFVLDDTA
jgi:dodecin